MGAVEVSYELFSKLKCRFGNRAHKSEGHIEVDYRSNEGVWLMELCNGYRGNGCMVGLLMECDPIHNDSSEELYYAEITIQ